MKMSIFRPVYSGEAAENLKLGERTLEVWPKELLPTLEGDVTTETIQIETKGIDANDQEYTASVILGGTVSAEWLGGGNIITPPNVRRGERLTLWQSGDSDEFYWKTVGRDQNLRRLETIIICFSANPSNKDQEKPDPSNSYYLEVNTHDKLCLLYTSDAADE